MKIGDVYEVIPLLQITVGNFGVVSSGFYGRFIGYDSSGKCVFEHDGKYRGYWEAGEDRDVMQKANIIPLTPPKAKTLERCDDPDCPWCVFKREGF